MMVRGLDSPYYYYLERKIIMNDLKYNYLIFEGISSGEYRIIDRQRKVICSIKDGRYINDTKECLKIYIKDKGKDWENRRMGYNWIKCLITGNERETMSKAVLKTNNLKEFDLKCFEIMQEQIKGRERNIEYYKERLNKNEQYYTYAFSNLDYVIGEDFLDESYFETKIEKENTLERIIKPYLDSEKEKEQEYTIIDEVYDLRTTFYYVEEPKDDYEKFMKFMSENLVVNEIWKDNTIIVKLNDFVKEHVRELSNLFGKQTEEVHIENLIKMIEGNATESCYSDFRKEFKTDFKFTELIPLSLVKMFSSSASTGLLLDIFKAHGADSLLGKTAAIMMSSTETIFYTLSVYFMSVKIKKTRYTVAGALIATIAGLFASIYFARFV